MENKITIELSPLMAQVLQRMLVEEIENKERWAFEEEKEFGVNEERTKVRENIINECEEVRTQIEQKGFTKYFKCY